MLGISYREYFLIIGAKVALIGPKYLPIIARTARRLLGRAIGYVQLACGQFENAMQQSQANQVHKELQYIIAQLEAICYEIRSISIMNPSPLTRRLIDNLKLTSDSSGNWVLGSIVPQNFDGEHRPTDIISKECSSTTSTVANLQSQAVAFARLAKSPALKNG